jgi:eukaryotic-like serine/threonine-protein kinase
MTMVPGGLPLSLGKYRFVATLGHGGMAEVFLAVAMGPAGFNKLQVIKRLRPNLAEDPDLCAMFLDEARLAARLNHRNVVQTNEVDRVDGQYFMAMEYLDGQPLHRVLVQAKKLGRPLPPAAISRVLCDTLAGLHYAHQLTDYDGAPLGVVHRDVSPQNIFVTYDGQVKIVDFGIAKAARRVVETATGVIKGKVSYMAPEQAFGDVDRRADVFSVGVVLWELLAGQRLWHGMGDPEILAALVREVPRLRSAVPGVGPELARICDRALALERDERHATAAELRAELERAVPPCSGEALGVLVEGLFHDQRREIKAALARQVDLVEHGAGADLLELDRGEGRRSVPPPRALSSEAPPSIETPPPSTMAPGRDGGHPQTPRPAGRTPLLVAAALLAGVAVVAYVLVPARREAASSATPAAPPVTRGDSPAPANATAAVVAPSTTPADAYIQVHFASSPPEARILVDGAALPANPFDGKFMKDGAVHRIQIEAAGFAPLSRLVVFDKDQTLDLALQPRPKPAEAPGMKPDPYR